MHHPLHSRMLQRFVAVVASATLSTAFIILNPAGAADIAPRPSQINYNTTSAGVCGHEHVLSNIAYNFYHQVRHVPDLPKLRIAGWSDIVVTRFQPALDRYGIQRTFCTANAVMNDGLVERVWYVVEKSPALSGIDTTNVQFCVNQFDNWRVYDGNCRNLH